MQFRNHHIFGALQRAIALACAVLGFSSFAFSADGTSQKEVINQTTVILDQLIQKAHEGKITQEQLRAQRKRVEQKLNASLANAPVEVHTKQQVAVNQARTDLNQKIIGSIEFEFFGPEYRPEWGWFPSRQIQSQGSVLKVDTTGKATLTPAKN